MDANGFRERLLEVMEAKLHWAWPAFTRGQVAPDKLHIHLEQEYATYVRDFPILVGKAYVQCPVAAVRRELAENLYEEETGGLVAGRPHPELFLRYPEGLDMDLSRFERVDLLPASAVYHHLLHALCGTEGWEVGCAVSTIFVEGTAHDRSVLDPRAPARPEPALEDHPLVRHYGLPLEHLALTKAHRQVEGDHRMSAWTCVLDHVAPGRRGAVVQAMQAALEAWKAYRDGVAAACGVTSP